jgi:hypothetical protein
VAELAGRDPAGWEERGFSYPTALALTSHLESLRGFGGIVRILDRLAEGSSADAALRAELGYDYGEMCRRWARDVGDGADG